MPTGTSMVRVPKGTLDRRPAPAAWGTGDPQDRPGNRLYCTMNDNGKGTEPTNHLSAGVDATERGNIYLTFDDQYLA